MMILVGVVDIMRFSILTSTLWQLHQIHSAVHLKSRAGASPGSPSKAGRVPFLAISVLLFALFVCRFVCVCVCVCVVVLVASGAVVGVGYALHQFAKYRPLLESAGDRVLCEETLNN